MTTEIAGLPFWEVRFDEQGDPDAALENTLVTEARQRGVTDLVVFSHGWNNDASIAMRLYTAFFTVLAGQLQHRRDAATTVGLVGVHWPARRWSDEPIPDFVPVPAAAPGGGGAAALGDPARPPGRDLATPPTTHIDDTTLNDLTALFPAAAPGLTRMAALLEGPATPDAVTEFKSLLDEYAASGAGEDDGEETRDRDPAQPGMLQDDGPALFVRFRDAAREQGLAAPDDGGEAGIGDTMRGIWLGAKEALRQATYWQMKNRAGVVGKHGLGPLLGRAHAALPETRFHLVGHSFGARLVSFALAGLPPGDPSPVKSLTLLQGAFSHFAFAQPLPLDASRNGALAGMPAGVDGPLVVCFSEHDGAVGTFYPLASLAARDDSAAADRALWRWGGMGADGAQGVGAVLRAIGGAGPGTTYPFAQSGVLNIDASAVVRRGGPPSGAHSDIVHPELTWVVLTAAGIVTNT
ncbi:MAG TPA: hypothetical protein VES95_00970 [Dermatophilaceae bacterium]|nr:hypothetical protein [Dermatophilaceae bacterium]